MQKQLHQEWQWQRQSQNQNQTKRNLVLVLVTHFFHSWCSHQHSHCSRVNVVCCIPLCCSCCVVCHQKTQWTSYNQSWVLSGKRIHGVFYTVLANSGVCWTGCSCSRWRRDYWPTSNHVWCLFQFYTWLTFDCSSCVRQIATFCPFSLACVVHNTCALVANNDLFVLFFQISCTHNRTTKYHTGSNQNVSKLFRGLGWQNMYTAIHRVRLYCAVGVRSLCTCCWIFNLGCTFLLHVRCGIHSGLPIDYGFYCT